MNFHGLHERQAAEINGWSFMEVFFVFLSLDDSPVTMTDCVQSISLATRG